MVSVVWSVVVTCVSTCARGAGTHGDVLNRDTEGVLNVHTVPLPPLSHHAQTQTHTHQPQHQQNITRRQTDRQREKETERRQRQGETEKERGKKNTFSDFKAYFF